MWGECIRGKSGFWLGSCVTVLVLGLPAGEGQQSRDGEDVVVRDSEGRPRIRLGSLGEGSFGLTLLDEEGRSQVELFASKLVSGWFVKDPTSGATAFARMEGKGGRALLGVMGEKMNEGVVLEHEGGKLSRVVVLDGEGDRGASMELSRDGRGFMVFRDGEAVSALVDNGDVAGLAVWDCDDPKEPKILIQRRKGESKSIVELGRD